jgi:hypothetical protein
MIHFLEKGEGRICSGDLKGELRVRSKNGLAICRD